MGVVEVVLLLVGVGAFLLGYLLPAGKKDMDEEVQLISEAEIRKLIEGETEGVRERISEIVSETIGYSIEKTERAMERVANEKIMAVNEYSDTVLEEINKNHKEVIFLYDMLNDKHDSLMAAIGQAAQAAEEIRQTMQDARITADEALKKAKDAEGAAEEALQRIHRAQDSARQAQEAVQEAVESVMGMVEDTRVDMRTIRSARPYTPPAIEPQPSPRERLEEPPYAVFAVEEEREEPVYAPVAGALPEEVYEPEESFRPMRPKRVEIIHEPEADYVAPEPEISAAAAFAELGIFGNGARGQRRKQAAEPVHESVREPVWEQIREPVREAFREPVKEPVREEPRGVDIHFTKGQDNGRNSNERILELHKAGKSNMAIAKELGLGLGEVKLVIDLFEGM